jgi:general secretion pathway protein M
MIKIPAEKLPIDKSPPAPLFQRGEKEVRFFQKEEKEVSLFQRREDGLPFEKETLEKTSVEIEKTSVEIEKTSVEKGISPDHPFEKGAPSSPPFEKGTPLPPPFKKGGLGGIDAKGGIKSNRPCILLWLVTLSGGLLVLIGLILPWHNYIATLEEHIANTYEQVMRYQRLVQTLPQLKTELAALKNNAAEQVFYFKAATPALAGAQLQTQVQDIVAAAQGRLVSTQLLPAEKNQQPPRVQVRTQIQGTTATVLDIVQRLDQAQPLLFIDRLSVRSAARSEPLPPPPPAGRAPNQLQRPRPPSNPAGELTVQLDIFGFALAGAPK